MAQNPNQAINQFSEQRVARGDMSDRNIVIQKNPMMLGS